MYWSMTLNLEESSEWHSHGVYELIYCNKGDGHVLLDDKKIPFRAGRFILILPKNRHKLHFEQEESADLKFLCLTSADTAVNLSPALLNWLNKIQNAGIAFSDHGADSEISDIFHKIPDKLGETEKMDTNIIWSRIGLALSIHCKNQTFSDTENPGRHGDRVSTVCSWIDNNIEKNLNIDLIASEFGMSRSLLTKEFRKHTNTSIVEYINTRRLQKAGSIISATDKSITEAALESGFTSIGNFYRKFKELYGVTPSEFKKHFDMKK